MRVTSFRRGLRYRPVPGMSAGGWGYCETQLTQFRNVRRSKSVCSVMGGTALYCPLAMDVLTFALPRISRAVASYLRQGGESLFGTDCDMEWDSMP